MLEVAAGSSFFLKSTASGNSWPLQPGGSRMTRRLTVRAILIFLCSWFWCQTFHAVAQERVKIAYSSADASNTVWFTALDAGLYRKHGLDVELIFIQSSTMSVSTVVSADIQIANVSGGAVPSAPWAGPRRGRTGC